MNIKEFIYEAVKAGISVTRCPGESTERYQVRAVDGSKYLIYKRVGADYPLTWFIIKTEGFSKKSKILSGAKEIASFSFDHPTLLGLRLFV